MIENQLSRWGAISRDISFDKLGPAGRIFIALHPYAYQVSSSNTGASWYSTVVHEFPVDKQGKPRIYSTIQGAIDATETGRGDIVLVGPGKWKEEAYVVNKIGIKLIGYGGRDWNGGYMVQMRPSDASTHYAFTTKLGNASSGAAFHIMSKSVEVCGFFFDGGGGYAGIYAGGGLNGCTTGYGGTVYTTENASGLYVHHCFFRGGSEGVTGLYLNGPRFGCLVENCIFERWTGAAIEIDAGNASTEFAIIRNNYFLADNGAYGIRTYGEANSVLGCTIDGNVFADRVSHAFTYAVSNSSGSTGVLSVTRNAFACANKMDLLATDYHCGNFSGTASATEVYVHEA